MLETERLILRKWRPEDLAPFSSLNADPEVMRFFEAPQSKHYTADLMNRCNKLLEDWGFTFWAVELKENNRCIGMVGLAPVGDEMPFGPSVEIGWRLDRAYWGLGLAPEGACEALRFGFEKAGLSEIVSFTALQNIPSQRVMEKIGMSRDAADDFIHPKVSKGHPLAPHCLYRLKAVDFSFS